MSDEILKDALNLHAGTVLSYSPNGVMGDGKHAFCAGLRPQIALCEIAAKYGTDKLKHGYTLYYDKLFKNNRNIENFLELGIFRGASAKMWWEYFYQANIYCVDNCKPEKSSEELICPPSVLEELNLKQRIKAINCEQDDRVELTKIFKDIKFDYIVDDASHLQKETQISLAILFKNLISGGTYIIEDTITMYDMQLGNIRKRNGWGIRLGQPELPCPIAYYEANGKLRNESLFKDSTWYVLNKFIEAKIFDSLYLTEEENEYLTNHIENIEIIAAPQKKSDKTHSALERGKGRLLKDVWYPPIHQPLPEYTGTPNSKLKAGSLIIINKKAKDKQH